MSCICSCKRWDSIASSSKCSRSTFKCRAIIVKTFLTLFLQWLCRMDSSSWAIHLPIILLGFFPNHRLFQAACTICLSSLISLGYFNFPSYFIFCIADFRACETAGVVLVRYLYLPLVISPPGNNCSWSNKFVRVVWIFIWFQGSWVYQREVWGFRVFVATEIDQDVQSRVLVVDDYSYWSRFDDSVLGLLAFAVSS